MKNLGRISHHRTFHLFLCLVALLLFNYPLIRLFFSENREISYWRIFGGWLGIILLLALIGRHLIRGGSSRAPGEK